MTKFINWLNEGRSRDLYEKEVVDLLQNNCKQALTKWQKGFRIFRATYKRDDFLLTKPTGDRRSANVESNYYTLILNNHPLWKNYPKREIICSGGSGLRAKNHGLDGVFWVFPYDNAKIGICPVDDIWRSFEELKDKGIFNMKQFNELIEFSGLNIPDDNWNNFVRMAKEVTVNDIVKDVYWSMGGGLTSDDLEMHLYHFITKYMAPESNNFKVQTMNQYNINPNDDLEVWTDVPCVLINVSVDYEWLEKL